jgi:hypothetical protein
MGTINIIFMILLTVFSQMHKVYRDKLEAVMAYINILSQHLPGGTEEKQKQYRLV